MGRAVPRPIEFYERLRDLLEEHSGNRKAVAQKMKLTRRQVDDAVLNGRRRGVSIPTYTRSIQATVERTYAACLKHGHDRQAIADELGVTRRQLSSLLKHVRKRWPGVAPPLLPATCAEYIPTPAEIAAQCKAIRKANGTWVEPDDSRSLDTASTAV